MRLVVPYTASSPVYPFSSGLVVAFPNSNLGTSSCDIQFGFEVVPFHQPIPLPAAVVVDLRYSSQNLLTLATGASGATVAPNIDILFSPRGTIAGASGGLGSFYLCLRDVEDASPGTYANGPTLPPRDPSDPTCKGDCLILAVNPATGLVQTYAADVTDNFNNSTGAAGADGFADNLFRFAQAGKAAGR